jgi:hypothetical protein
MTATYFRERAEWCVALARQISDGPAADALRIDAAAYLVRAEGLARSNGFVGGNISIIYSSPYYGLFNGAPHDITDSALGVGD